MIRETVNNKPVTNRIDIIGLRKDGDSKNTPKSRDVHNTIALDEIRY
mgnify:CR=1 FL=1